MEISRAPEGGGPAGMSAEERQMAIDRLEEQMLAAAGNLDFEKAAKLRDQMLALRGEKPLATNEKIPSSAQEAQKMRNDKIIVRGAREHNLKNVSVELPRDSLIVMTGLSRLRQKFPGFRYHLCRGAAALCGIALLLRPPVSGADGEPDVDSIDGLSPAISIDQKTTSKNPRSTVGTVTEIHDYLRLLYARAGVPHCPVCGKEIRQQTVDQIVDQVLTLPERTRIQVMAPVVRSRKGEYAKHFEDMGKQGFVRMRVDGEICEIADPPKLTKTKKHTLEVVVDRLTVRADIQQRLTDSLEAAMKLAGGLVMSTWSAERTCSFPELRLPGLQHLH